MATLLKTENIVMKFEGLTAINNLNLEIQEHQIFGLIGPNGAGKTTAFNVITGFLVPTEGKVYFKGEDITGLKPNHITKRGIARTFQNIKLFPEMSVIENVMTGFHIHRKFSFFEAMFRLPRFFKDEAKMYKKGMELLDLVGLTQFANDQAGSLPYGHQRKLEIARALATAPTMLLLDEPAAGMNPQESSELMDLIRKLRDEMNLTILLIEHDMKVVMGICERIKVLDHGEEIAEGTPEEIRNNPRVIEAYLGEARKVA